MEKYCLPAVSGDYSSPAEDYFVNGLHSTNGASLKLDAARPRRFLDRDITIRDYSYSQIIPSDFESQILSLFQSHYFRYHYLAQMLAQNRHRIVALIGTSIVGFCSLEKTNSFAVLSNLLVAEAYRGYGIGSSLESARLSICQDEGLTPYSSCSSDGIASQLLKLKHGLVPINIKYGYRQNVYKQGRTGSAISYVSPDFNASLPTKNSGKIDVGNKRIRIIGFSYDFILRMLSDLGSHEGFYVDVVTTPNESLKLINHRSLTFHGLDIIPAESLWGLVWQHRNSLYERGRDGANEFVIAPEVLQSTIWRQYVGGDFPAQHC